MTLSLIMATYGDDKIPFIKDFLLSINNQSFSDFELIVVDQNEDNAIEKVIRDGKWQFNINYLKSSPGLSKARNLGLKSAKGRIVSFPDDDCLYTEDLLLNINNFFNRNKDIDLLAIDTRDTITLEKLPYTKKVSGDFEIKKDNIFKTITSISIFCKNHGTFFFDEKLGLGTKFPSCEEFDFVTAYLKHNKRCFFTDRFYVLHANHTDLNNDVLIKKIKKHALGHGAYFKKHLHFIFPTVFYNMLISPIGGFLLGLITFNFNKSRIYWSFLVTRLKGFITFKTTR